MKNLFIVGGSQREGTITEWHQYEKGVILRYKHSKDKVAKVLEYVTPPSLCPDHNPSIQFTAGTVKDDILYICTHTELLVYDLPCFTLDYVISLPSFHDLHHVKPLKNGDLLAVNTGLDMVMQISPEGEVVEEWSVIGENIWDRFSKETDYRKVLTTKPHLSHPNFVFTIGNEIWVTRCLQKDAISLTRPGRRIPLDIGLVHDGIVFKNYIYFTCVLGIVIKVDKRTLEVVATFDLREMCEHTVSLGWCRGIKIISENEVIVGFSRIRPTKVYNEDGSIEEKGSIGVLPTRIAYYNLKNKELVWEKNVEEHGINSIYSIHTLNE